MRTHILRGDIVLADLDPVCGCEQGGTRPVLIVQSNVGNDRSATTIAAVIARRRNPSLPTRIPLSGVPELKPGSVILLDHIRTLDERRLSRKLCSLDARRMRLVDAALMASLGIRAAPIDPMLMTLCRTCAQSFRDAGGYILRQVNSSEDEMESCTVCSTRAAYDFEVTRL